VPTGLALRSRRVPRINATRWPDFLCAYRQLSTKKYRAKIAEKRRSRELAQVKI
jgi:hypothetical protein